MKARFRRLAPLALLVLAAWAAVQWLAHAHSDRLGREVAANTRPGDIVMLSSVTCPYCKQARAWFNEHQVPFTECMIEQDRACKAAYDALQSPGTPTLVVRGKRQVGFNAERVAQALRSG